MKSYPDTGIYFFPALKRARNLRLPVVRLNALAPLYVSRGRVSGKFIHLHYPSNSLLFA